MPLRWDLSAGPTFESSSLYIYFPFADIYSKNLDRSRSWILGGANIYLCYYRLLCYQSLSYPPWNSHRVIWFFTEFRDYMYLLVLFRTLFLCYASEIDGLDLMHPTATSLQRTAIIAQLKNKQDYGFNVNCQFFCRDFTERRQFSFISPAAFNKNVIWTTAVYPRRTHNKWWMDNKIAGQVQLIMHHHMDSIQFQWVRLLGCPLWKTCYNWTHHFR